MHRWVIWLVQTGHMPSDPFKCVGPHTYVQRMGEGISGQGQAESWPTDMGHDRRAQRMRVVVHPDNFLDFVERMAMTARDRIEALGVTIIERGDVPRVMWFPISLTLIIPPNLSRDGWECALLDVMWTAEAGAE